MIVDLDLIWIQIKQLIKIPFPFVGLSLLLIGPFGTISPIPWYIRVGSGRYPSIGYVLDFSPFCSAIGSRVTRVNRWIEPPKRGSTEFTEPWTATEKIPAHRPPTPTEVCVSGVVCQSSFPVFLSARTATWYQWELSGLDLGSLPTTTGNDHRPTRSPRTQFSYVEDTQRCRCSLFMAE